MPSATGRVTGYLEYGVRYYWRATDGSQSGEIDTSVSSNPSSTTDLSITADAGGAGTGGILFRIGSTIMAQVLNAGRFVGRLLDKGGQAYSVDAYGAIGDGTSHPLSEAYASLAVAQVVYPHATSLSQTIDWAAWQAAQNDAGTTYPVVGSPGKNYYLNDSITTGNSFTWLGVRGERGAGPTAVRSCRITFRPTDTTTYLVSRFETNTPAAHLGPFIIRNITVDIGDANGLELGRADLDGDGVPDPIGAGASQNQRFVTGTKVEHVTVLATQADRNSDASGVITRSGRKMFSFANAYETSFRDVALYGCDTQVYTWGCDKPTFDDVRSLYSHVPFDLNGSGASVVQHTLTNIQVEGWTFTPIKSDNVQLAVAQFRLEEIDLTPTGSRRFVLPGVTVSVTAGSGQLTFSASMDNILFPGLSLIELTDGTNTDVCLVTAVSGTAVTVDTEGFDFTWTHAAATVTRIHSFGPMHRGDWNATYTGGSVGAGSGTHLFVYVVGRGTMHLAAVGTEYGESGHRPSLVVGNRHIASSSYMYSQMSFDGCSATVLADPAHPLVYISNYGSQHGRDPFQVGSRGFAAKLDEERALLRRAWVYTPKAGISSANNQYLTTWKRIAGESATAEHLWAWLITGTNIDFRDTTLPSIQGKLYRMRLRVRGVSGSGTLSVFAGGAGVGSHLVPGTNAAFGTAWSTVAFNFTVPNAWATVNGRISSTSCSFVITPSVSIYLAAVEIEELERPFGAATSVGDGGTITHNLGTTPIWAKVTGSVAGEIVTVTALGATTMTVAIKKHDGTAGTSQTVYWEAVR